LYVFGLLQRDRNSEIPEILSQDFEYDSNYFGIGFKVDKLGVTATGEFIYETGHSIATASTSSQKIRSYAILAGLDYAPDVFASPTIFGEYLLASGDKDRSVPTSTIGGNRKGTKDRGFIPFGFVQTGYTLFPIFSNLRIYKFGVLGNPLKEPFGETFENFNLGLVYYIYRKDQRKAGITDPRADRDRKDIGQEVDLFIRWRILSDLGLSLNYGRFTPGDAYSPANDDKRDFLSLSMTYSF
jgi:hypothetical protein